MNIEQTNKWLQAHLTKERYIHSLSVAEEAARLAGRLGADRNKAFLAGLIHDCAKDMPPQDLLNEAAKFDIIPNMAEKMNPDLLHGPIGAVYCRTVFGIEDPEISRAIELHTTGGPEMTLLDKIIYLADYVEPGRKFSGVEQVRALLQTDVDDALLAAIDNTLVYVIRRGFIVHPLSVEAHNAIVARKRS